MNYVFCSSHGSLFIALDLKNSGKEITIITYSEATKKYCLAANITHIYFETIRPEFRLTIRPIRLIRLAVKALLDAVNLKNRLDALIEKINFGEEDSFYLLTRWISYEDFYLAKELSKKGKGTVYLSGIAWRELGIYRTKFNPVFFECLFNKYLLKIFLGLDLIFYETNAVPRFGINDKFLKKNKIKETTHDRGFFELVADVVKKAKTGQKRYDNLFLSESSAITSIITYESTRNIYKNLADLPLEFVVKKHPRITEEKSQIDILFEEFFKDWEELPEYIPAELFFNSIKKNVIAVMSQALIVASHLEHLRAISLLELVEWYNEAYKSEIKNLLMKMSKNRIIFVKDFEELKQVLIYSQVRM
ncbi:hypothetical protein ACFLYE_01660 [Chloroflexota bacterium]